MLTSLFALFTFGAYFTGLQQGRSSVRPEIRSSNTSIVQVDRSATTRLQAQVAQDGGSIEAPAVTPEQPAVEEERSDASADKPAPEPEPPTVEEVEVEEPETPVVEDEVELGSEDMSSDLDLPEDLPTNTDEIGGTDGGNEDVPEEPTLEEELTGGEQANQNLQEIADNIYGAGDRADAYLRENLGNGAGTVVSSPVRLVTGLGGLVTQGTGYVAEGAYDYVLAPIGRGATGAWNYFFGDDSNEDSDEDTPAEEPKVEEERSDAPTVENAPEAEASAVERPTVDNTGAEDGSAPAEPAEDGNWFTRGADAVGDFFTETIPGTARDVHNYMDENVYQPTGKVINENIVEPVQDLFNGDSDEKESEVEPPAPSPERPTVDNTGAEDGSAPAEPAEDGITLGGLWNDYVAEPAADAWNAVTGAVDEHVVQPIQDLFNGDSDEKESEVEPPAPAPTTKRPTVDNTGAEDGSAPAEPAEDGITLGGLWNDYVAEPAADAWNAVTGAVDEHVVQPVQDLFNGDSDEKESEGDSPAPAPTTERPTPDNTGAEDGSAPAEPAEEGNWFTRGADAVGDFFTETIPEVAEDAWDATTGAVDEYVVQPVQDLFNGDSDEDTSVEEPTVEEERSDAPTAEPPAPETPTADGQGEQAQSEEPWYKAAWNGFTGLLGFGSDDNISQTPTDDKPAGLNGQEPPVVRTVSPTGAREQAPETPDMTQLTEFLKSKGLSDEDIQTAVSLARGQTPQAPTPTAERPVAETPAPAPEADVSTPTVDNVPEVETPAPAPEADVSTSPADNAPEVEAPAPAPESSAGSLKDNLGALQQGQVPPEMKRYLQSIGLSEDEINRGWRHMHQQMQQQTPEQRQQKFDQGEIIRRRLEAQGLSQSAIAAEIFRFHGGLLDEAKSAEYANLVSNYRLVSSNPLYSFTGKDTSGLSITINGGQDNRRLVYVGPNPVLRNAPRGSNR